MALVGAICHSLTTAIPLSIVHSNKSGGPLEVPARWSGSARKKTPLIKALRNLSVSVRYWRTIMPELLLLFSTFSLGPSPSFIPLQCHSQSFYSTSPSPRTFPPFVFARCWLCVKVLHTPLNGTYHTFNCSMQCVFVLWINAERRGATGSGSSTRCDL